MSTVFPDFITARSKVWITTYVPLDWTGERKVTRLNDDFTSLNIFKSCKQNANCNVKKYMSVEVILFSLGNG